MQDKANLTAVIIGIVSFLVSAALIVLEPSAPVLLADMVILIPNFGFAAYWAFSVREALAVPTYRRQALGIGIVIVTIFGALTALILFPSGSTIASTFVQTVAFDALFVVIFYWIDASVLTTRRYDPLLRDVLYWRKIRVPLWTAIILTTVIPIAILTYIAATNDAAAFDQLINGTLGGPIIADLIDIAVEFSIVIPVLGLIYLPAIALRSKWNRNLRSHFLWFAPTALCILLLFFGPLSGTNSILEHAQNGLLVEIVGYTLYRSARSLVPMNRISSAEVGAKQTAPRP